MSVQRVIAAVCGLLVLSVAGAVSATGLNQSAKASVDVPGGELQFRWNRPGRTVRFLSSDGNIDLRPRVRLFFDGYVSDTEKTPLNDGVEVRKLRLSLSGRLWQDWRFKIDGEVSPDRNSYWRNLWIDYRGFERVSIKVGNQIPPIGLESSISSDNITFMERASPYALIPAYQFGGSVRTWTPLWSAKVGVFHTPIFREKDRQKSDGVSVSGRFSIAPINEEGRVLHFGTSFHYRAVDPSSKYRISYRPESASQPSLVNTGHMPGIDDAITFGLEAAGVYGPFSLQGEYLRTELISSGPDLSFDGGYIQASWFITGESRRYSVDKGIFSWIEPKGKWGAVELAGRWSRLDITDRNIRGGEQQNFTVGLNWYVNRNIRVMFNTVFVNANRPGSLSKDYPEIYQWRMQFVF